MQEITPNLWFDKEAKEAAKFYTSFFKALVLLHTRFRVFWTYPLMRDALIKSSIWLRMDT